MKYVALLLAFASVSFAISYHGCTLAPDNLNGWVVCIDTVLILRTMDGGLTWIPQSVPPDTISRRLFDVTCHDASRAWITGKHNYLAGEILATTDGGDHWYRQIVGFGKYGTRIEFIDQDHGWALSGDGALAMTTDGGDSLWEQIFTEWGEAEYYGVSFINPTVGWICAGWPDSVITGQGYIVPSTDGGLTWDTLSGYHAEGYEDFFDIHFFDAHNGIVVGGDESDYSPIILKTTDGGESWDSISTPPNTYYLRALDFVGNEGWAVGRFGSIIHTTDGGDTWAFQNSAAVNTMFDVDFSDNLHGFAVGQGIILRTTDGGQNWQPTAVEENDSEQPQTLSLEITPNPFRRTTDIRYRISDNFDITDLKIYDASGRLVRRFSVLPSATNHQTSVTWCGDDNAGAKVPAGVYFVEYQTTHTQVVKKVILLE